LFNTQSKNEQEKVKISNFYHIYSLERKSLKALINNKTKQVEKRKANITMKIPNSFSKFLDTTE
jgi:hypothetical protein